MHLFMLTSLFGLRRTALLKSTSSVLLIYQVLTHMSVRLGS